MRYKIESVDKSNTIRGFLCEYSQEPDYYAFHKAFDSCEPIKLKTIDGSVVFINTRDISHLSITAVESIAPEAISESTPA